MWVTMSFRKCLSCAATVAICADRVGARVEGKRARNERTRQHSMPTRKPVNERGAAGLTCARASRMQGNADIKDAGLRDSGVCATSKVVEHHVKHASIDPSPPSKSSCLAPFKMRT